MDEQIGTLQQQLADLNAELKAGQVYQSLGHRIGEVMDGIHRRRRTTVALPDDSDGIQELLDQLNEQLAHQEKLALTPANLQFLLRHLASLDPKIRYNGVNFTLYDALQQDAIGEQGMRRLISTLSSDQVLFNHVLEPANVAVFGRASAASLLAVVLHFVNEQSTPLDLDWHRLVIQVATYISVETDTRGVVNQQGWAHAYAAMVDLLAVLAASDQLTRADKLFLLVTYMERLKRVTTPLIYGENDRMAAYLVELTNRHSLYETAFLDSLKHWRQEVAKRRRPDNLAGWNQFFNRKRLLDALRLKAGLSPAIKKYLNSTIDFLG
ncbi:DUF2785 domain-containing protein [Levilactobacillus humaensis]|uniref:DUF2785 domain-containing protein n=1 Tax=Levilactobacillus humaensis TaxID=2950375 RepID=UPI0021C2F248|nr:DUF2785 domain-containing protein [Levilactobacillus humaensis]